MMMSDPTHPDDAPPVRQSRDTFTPRNLIVLSDGTGNSAAKLFRTNVWRIYEALDLNCPDQVALYDDGVGTAAFQPLAVLGGAFGFGLKRNVLDLYMFLCRNFKASTVDPANHDRIFAFGFSRGAFTARVVAALVTHQGLVQAADGAELKRLSRWAYRRYRAARYRNTLGVRLLRGLRDGLLRLVERVRGQRSYDSVPRRDVPIEFLGVFDTVAAYGLPIDELTQGWDRWIWPMLPRDRTLSPKVKRACHALALDDERQTFFPLLWNEADESKNLTSTHLGDERISQVWFAGVHSNVGGGYPDDSLALQPLCWIAGEAQQKGLRFQASLRPSQGPLPDSWIERAAPCAPMHDSRHGVGAYYRYHPRPVDRLCAAADGSVTIARPKLHESVFERVVDGRNGYAPITIPGNYALVTRKGEILHGADDEAGGRARPNPYEHPTQAVSRRRRQESAWNAVWMRRVVYFAMVGTTIAALLVPFSSILDEVAGPVDAYPRLQMVVDVLGMVVPGFAEPWLAHYRERPGQLLFGLLLVAALVKAGSVLSATITGRMAGAWGAQNLAAAPVTPVPEPDDPLYRLRTSTAYTGFFRFLSTTWWPNVFGIALVLILVVLLPVRGAFAIASRSESFCESTPATPINGGDAWEVALHPSKMCQKTAIQLEADTSYRIQIALPTACGENPAVFDPARRTGVWADRTIAVRSAAGFSSSVRAPFYAALPFRRRLTTRWFVPVAVIGEALPERHPLVDGVQDVRDRPRQGDPTGGTADLQFVAGRGGELKLFVNDAILPVSYDPVTGLCSGWDCYYRNNAGGPARVRVSKAALGPASPERALEGYSCDEQRLKASR
jgi:uncharacterized protein (DUF2235 family)